MLQCPGDGPVLQGGQGGQGVGSVHGAGGGGEEMGQQEDGRPGGSGEFRPQLRMGNQPEGPERSKQPHAEGQAVQSTDNRAWSRPHLCLSSRSWE